jgi:hypothetical protein
MILFFFMNAKLLKEPDARSQELRVSTRDVEPQKAFLVGASWLVRRSPTAACRERWSESVDRPVQKRRTRAVHPPRADH